MNEDKFFEMLTNQAIENGILVTYVDEQGDVRVRGSISGKIPHSMCLEHPYLKCYHSEKEQRK